MIGGHTGTVPTTSLVAEKTAATVARGTMTTTPGAAATMGNVPHAVMIAGLIRGGAKVATRSLGTADMTSDHGRGLRITLAEGQLGVQVVLVTIRGPGRDPPFVSLGSTRLIGRIGLRARRVPVLARVARLPTAPGFMMKMIEGC